MTPHRHTPAEGAAAFPAAEPGRSRDAFEGTL